MKKFFDGIKTKKELVKAFRLLAKRLHPDAGGDAEGFKAMKAEFDRLLKILPDDSVEAQEKATEGLKRDIPADLAIVLEKVIHLGGIEIEICGSWIWVSGNTYPVKDQIKAAGFKFSNNKKMWYWHAGEYHRRGRKMSIEEIRELHGSQEVKTSSRMAIA